MFVGAGEDEWVVQAVEGGRRVGGRCRGFQTRCAEGFGQRDHWARRVKSEDDGDVRDENHCRQNRDSLSRPAHRASSFGFSVGRKAGRVAITTRSNPALRAMSLKRTNVSTTTARSIFNSKVSGVLAAAAAAASLASRSASRWTN